VVDAGGRQVHSRGAKAGLLSSNHERDVLYVGMLERLKKVKCGRSGPRRRQEKKPPPAINILSMNAQAWPNLLEPHVCWAGPRLPRAPGRGRFVDKAVSADEDDQR